MDRRSQIDHTTLARRWGISESLAKNTMDTTTPRGMRYDDDQFTRRFCTRQAHLSYPHVCSGVFTDKLYYEITRIRGNTCAQLFVTDGGHARTYPLTNSGQAFDKLDLYCSTVGIPKYLASL